MSAIDADPQPERTLRRESRTWRLIRRILPLSRSIGSLFYLISVGLISTWIIAVFFGVGLFSLMPRPANLATGSSLGSARSNPWSAETPWLMQSTSRLDRLSAQPFSEPPQPIRDAGPHENRPTIVPENQNIANVNPHLMPPEQAAGRVFSNIGEPPPASSPEGETPAVPARPTPLQAFHSDLSHKRHSQRPVKNRMPSSHPPLQAIQDVMQKHSRLLK
jgi:hypothetical protein